DRRRGLRAQLAVELQRVTVRVLDAEPVQGRLRRLDLRAAGLAAVPGVQAERPVLLLGRAGVVRLALGSLVRGLTLAAALGATATAASELAARRRAGRSPRVQHVGPEALTSRHDASA